MSATVPMSDLPLGKLLQERRKQKGLTQEQLALKAGIPYTSLTKIESGAIRNPSAQVVSKLAKALAVSLDALLVPQTYFGPGSVPKIFEDVLETLSDGDYMCISGIAEKDFLKYQATEVTAFVDALKARGITQKLLCCEGDTTFLPGEHLEYRWIPKQHFFPSPIYVYGNKVSFLVWGPPQQSAILEHELMAEAHRRQFLFMWEHATPVPAKSRAGGRRVTRRK